MLCDIAYNYTRSANGPLSSLQLPVLTQTTASIVDDGGSAATVTSTREEVGCYLSQEQTVQLWTQLQQVCTYSRYMYMYMYVHILYYTIHVYIYGTDQKVHMGSVWASVCPSCIVIVIHVFSFSCTRACT